MTTYRRRRGTLPLSIDAPRAPSDRPRCPDHPDRVNGLKIHVILIVSQEAKLTAMVPIRLSD